MGSKRKTCAEDVRVRIQEYIDEYVEIQEKCEMEKVKEERRHQEYIKERADEFLVHLYSDLRNHIFENVGCEDGVGIRTLCYGIRCSPEDVARIVKEKTGLTVVLREESDHGDYVEVRFANAELKACTVFYEDELRELDFPALFVENARLNQAWHSLLPGLAQNWVEQCSKRLEEMSDLAYGLDENLLLVNARGKPLLEGYFVFCKKRVWFQHLSSEHLASLADQMSSMIRGGKVEFRKDEDGGGWQTYLEKTPEDVMLSGDFVFDYFALCQQYDGKNEALEAVFEHITENLRLPDEGSQILSLRANHELYYDFDVHAGLLDYFTLKKKLSRSPQREWLFEATETAIPGIRVTDVMFKAQRNRDDTDYAWQKMVFSYELVGQPSEIIAQQVAVDQKIQYIKSRCVQYLADQLIARILDRVDRLGVRFYILGDNRGERLSNIELDFVMEGKVKGCKVDLREVRDEKWLKRLDGAVARKSGGFIRLNLAYMEYHLAFE